MFKAITISTAAFPQLKMGIDAKSFDTDTYPPAKMIYYGDNRDIELLVKKGLDGKSDTISLMVVNEGGADVKKYLRYGDNCCYLTFDTLISSGHRDYDPMLRERRCVKCHLSP